MSPKSSFLIKMDQQVNRKLILISDLVSHDFSDNLAISLMTQDGEDGYYVFSSIPSRYGILTNTEEKELEEYQPALYFTSKKYPIKGYTLIKQDEQIGYLYMRNSK